jgi:2'-5' RNA ligase
MRLFLAIWPDDAVLRRIEAGRRQWFTGRPPGRPVGRANLHITLQFLGQTGEENLECIRQAAGSIHFPAFDLRLDHLGHWARPRVVWLGCHRLPEALPTLVADLNTAMAACGFAPETRPFHPHLTLQRKVHRFVPREIDPIDWRVDAFVLVQSDTRPEGVEYRVIGRWPASPGPV